MKFGLKEITLGASLALGCSTEQKSTEPPAQIQEAVDPIQLQCRQVGWNARRIAEDVMRGLEWSSSGIALYPLRTANRTEQECLANKRINQ